MPETHFSGKTVLITGGGSGIGRATASAFARGGATVVIGDLNLGAAQESANLIRESHGNAIPLKVEVSDAASVDALMRRIAKDFGRLDIAVNNAGIAPPPLPTADTPEADFDRVIEVNLKGVWLCMKAEIPLLLATGAGSIVNTASVLGLVGIRHAAPYVAAKHGVIGLTKSAALEYAAQGLRINAVCPGVIATPLTTDRSASSEQAAATVALHPIGRLGTADEVAEAIVWLASPRASFATGTALVIDGGWSAQ